MRSARYLTLLAGAALALGPALPAAASHDVTPARIGGEDRFETAAEIALESHPDGASEVLVASGATYPDALAGAPLATAWDAPLLLTAPDSVPESTLAALGELEPDHVTILGGTNAVSAEAEATISQAARASTDRVYGETRYDTSAEITREVQQATGNAPNWPGGQRAAFVTTGENFPDALAAGAVAARAGAPVPVLLTHPDVLPEATNEAIEDLGIELAVVVGGSAAVSPAVEDQIDDADTTTDRVAGTSRTDTAAALADYAIQYLDVDASTIHLARGDTYPDGLTIAPLSGALHAPILLAATPTQLSDETRAWLAEQCGAIERIRAVGGRAAITAATLDDAVTTAEQCHTAEDGFRQTVQVSPMERITIDLSEGDEHSRTFEAFNRTDTAADGIQQPHDVTLFPCESIQEPTEGDFRLADANGNGQADGIASTSTGAASIIAVNGRAPESLTHERDVEPNADARIDVTVDSNAQDCAAVMVFQDVDNDSALNVDDEGYPTEPWGFGLVEWTR